MILCLASFVVDARCFAKRTEILTKQQNEASAGQFCVIDKEMNVLIFISANGCIYGYFGMKSTLKLIQEVRETSQSIWNDSVSMGVAEPTILCWEICQKMDLGDDSS